MASPSVWREEFQQVEIESTAQSIGEARPAGKTGARASTHNLPTTARHKSTDYLLLMSVPILR